MIANLRLAELLEAMKKQAGGAVRLRRAIAKEGPHPTEKTVRTWLKKSEDELRRLHPSNIEEIINAAPNLGIEPLRFASGPPLWDVEQPYQENLRRGLLEIAPRLARPFRNHGVRFLGYTLDSPFGASASVLTSNAARVRFLAATGADVITYKTVRSRPYGGHPKPNIFYCVSGVEPLDPDLEVPSVRVCDASNEVQPVDGMMNRYGMPTPAPEVWRADFRAARDCMRRGQLLILSVVGSAEREDPPAVLVSDFVRVVKQAVEVGAEVIELNLRSLA